MQKVYEIDNARLTVLRTHPPSLSITVEGKTSTPGFTEFHLEHYVYINPPADGIYDADMVATPPAGIALQVITPFEHTEVWEGYPVEHLKGMRIHSGTNNLEAMVD
jgi:hypothetical protein